MKKIFKKIALLAVALVALPAFAQFDIYNNTTVSTLIPLKAYTATTTFTPVNIAGYIGNPLIMLMVTNDAGATPTVTVTLVSTNATTVTIHNPSTGTNELAASSITNTITFASVTAAGAAAAYSFQTTNLNTLEHGTVIVPTVTISGGTDITSHVSCYLVGRKKYQ